METNIPIDLAAVEPKRVLGLTTRQIVCFSLAALFGVPVFLFINHLTNSSSVAMIGLVIAASPFITLLVYKRDGIPAEVILKDWLKWKRIHPQIRKYKVPGQKLKKRKVVK